MNIRLRRFFAFMARHCTGRVPDLAARARGTGVGNHHLYGQSGLAFALAIPIEVKSTVGAGDSFPGGFLYGLVQGATPASALATAIKAGSAAGLNSGTQLVDRGQFENLGKSVG